MTRLSFLLVPVAAALLAAAPAAAHVTVEPPAAAGGATLKLTLRVNHGCEGSATTRLRVRLPEALHGAQPLLKPGWSLAAPRTALAQPYLRHGRQVTEEVREITWEGGSVPDAFADEFAFVATLPEQPQRLALQVVQECERGRIEWFQLPSTDPATVRPEHPAVMLEVLTAPAGGHDHY
jgi:uncharacterized protein YcnI